MIENAFLLFLVQSAILIASTHVALLFLKRSPALRQAIIRAALVGCVALAAFSVWRFNQPPASLPRPSARVTLPSLPAPAPASTRPSVMTQPTVESAPPATKFLPELPVALTVWMVGVLVGSLYLAAGLVKLRRLKQQSRSWTSPEFETLAAQLCHRKVAVRTGSSVRTPFVTGVIRPTIFLPDSLSVNPDPTLELVLRHELAHVTNRDLGFLLLHRVLTIVLWPQVLLWTLRKPMLEASEEVCDRIALSTSTGSPTLGTDYAKALLALHNRFQPERAASLGVGMVRKSSGLKRRIAAILDPNQRPPNKRGKYALVGVTAILFGTVAILIAAPTGQDEAKGQPNFSEFVEEPYGGPVKLFSVDGKPLTNGAVWLLTEVANRKDAQLLPIRNGQVVVPELAEGVHTGRLIVNSNAGFGWAQLWPAMKRVTEVKLFRPEKLTGQLLLPNGKPAKRMDVAVRMILKPKSPNERNGREALLLEQQNDYLKIQTRTDDKGNYVFRQLPAGCSVRLDVSDRNFAPPVFLDDIQLKSTGQTNAKSLTLRAAGSISGRVIRNGNPVAGMRIAAQATNDSDVADGWGTAMTNVDGSYTIHRLLPTSYNVIVDFGYRAQGPSTAVAKERIKVVAGKNVAEQNFELIPGVIVSGAVRDLDGKPIRRAEVFIYSRAHPKSTAWVQGALADEMGRYQLRVPAGEISIYLADGTSETIESQVEEGKENIINLVRTKKRDW
ncbi:M56_BlaR1_MecR1_like domain containing protein [Fimbriimonadaceae bacterium]